MNTSTSLAGGQDQLASRLRHITDEAEQLLSAVADSGDLGFEAAREELSKQVKHMRARLERLEGVATHKARDALKKTDRTVHDHPYTAMGLAAAAGLLIGFMAARR